MVRTTTTDAATPTTATAMWSRFEAWCDDLFDSELYSDDAVESGGVCGGAVGGAARGEGARCAELRRERKIAINNNSGGATLKRNGHERSRGEHVHKTLKNFAATKRGEEETERERVGGNARSTASRWRRRSRRERQRAAPFLGAPACWRLGGGGINGADFDTAS
jgi:hypothetical protein